MFAGPIAATVDAPQDPGLPETRLRAPKFRQVRAVTGATDGVPAAVCHRRDVRRRALSRQSAIFLTVLFIIPLYVCPSYDAHTPSIVSEVSLYITWFLVLLLSFSVFLGPVLGLVDAAPRSSAGLLIVVAVVPVRSSDASFPATTRRLGNYGCPAALVCFEATRMGCPA